MDSSDQSGPAPIEQIGSYRILKRLGGGGFGEVYLGESTTGLTRQVAIKVFRPKDENLVAFATSSDEEGLAVLRVRFVREANILVQLEDAPHVINIHELGELDDGSPYYVMGFVPRALSAEIGRDMFTAAQEELPEAERPRPLAFERAISLFEQILHGVAAAHAKGLVHRDLKPSNLLLTDDDRIRVADFGIAKAPDTQHSTVSQLGIGSRNYMAPEQRESAKHVDARADVYALGVIAYRMFTGRLPGTRMQDPNVLCPAMSPALNQLILDCLEEDREARPADAGAVLQRYRQAKQRMADGDATSTSTKTTAGPAPKAVRDELAPLRERILQVFTTHGEVPQADWETLEVMGAVEGLDAGEVRQLAEQVAEDACDELKRLRTFLALIDDRVAEHGANMPDSTRAALHMGGARVGRNEAQVDARITEVAARVDLVEEEGAAESQRSSHAEVRSAGAAVPADPAVQANSESAGAASGERRMRAGDLAFSLAGLLVVGAILWFAIAGDGTDEERVTRPESTAPSVERGTQADGQVRQIAALEAAIETDIAANRLMSPAGDNAMEGVEALRALDPNRAQQFQLQVAEAYKNLARSALASNDTARAATYIDRLEVLAGRRWASIVEELRGELAAVALASSRHPGATFRDRLSAGGQGPKMVVVPAGSFQMGCVSGQDCEDDELPVRTVRIAQPFAIGVHEVTFEDFDLFARVTNGRLPSDAGHGRGHRPVINVSWEDAQNYVRWLSAQTGERYRLPTEAEWEYAARASTQTPYWTGSSVSRGQASFENQPYPYPSEVGSFGANSFGLFDTMGNVWEWTEDCYAWFEGAPVDGSAVEEGDVDGCSQRVMRGGSFFVVSRQSRSASRHAHLPTFGFVTFGFRVARDL